MRREPTVFVGTLFSGENELAACIEALESQSYNRWQQYVFSHLPNRAAHRTLYRAIMELREEFEVFVKLDADMVLRHPDCLQAIVEMFFNEPNLDHAVFSVHDWYSQTDILGLHAFSKRVSWLDDIEPLFVDPDPLYQGLKRVVTEPPAPIADHCPDPSLEEAFLFGFHRGLKVAQKRRSEKNVMQSEYQLSLLRTVWNQFVATGDLRRGAVLWGAESAFEAKVGVLDNKADVSAFRGRLETLRDVDSTRLQLILQHRWQSHFGSAWRQWRYVTRPKVAQRVKRIFYQVVKKPFAKERKYR